MDEYETAPYFIKTVSGVRVAIVGITTETVPSWEKKENYAPLKFQSAVAVAKKTVAELRASKKADVIVISAHTGLDRDTRTGVVHEQSLANEQVAYQIAESAGADAVIFGHTHAELASYKVGDVLMMQPRNW